MTVDTMNKAKDLHREINKITFIIYHLKNRTINTNCIMSMESDRSLGKQITIDDETILVSMCDLLISEHTEKLNRLQKELDNL